MGNFEGMGWGMGGFGGFGVLMAVVVVLGIAAMAFGCRNS